MSGRRWGVTETATTTTGPGRGSEERRRTRSPWRPARAWRLPIGWNTDSLENTPVLELADATPGRASYSKPPADGQQPLQEAGNHATYQRR